MVGLPIYSLSDVLGYTSIACWLCAQFPQVVENFRRQSCEGLALPFLANWFLGDLSNLIGCILTHQLPFQTYLATYFVLIDAMLVTQYFYYQRRAQKRVPLLGRAHTRATSISTRRMSIDRGVPRYRTLSAVAANVAAGAALVAQHDEQQHPRPRWQRSGLSKHRERSGSQASKDLLESDIDEDALATMADSFHSEGGQLSGRKRVSWSTERFARMGGGRSPILSRSTFLPPLQMAATDSPVDFAGVSDRGRPLQRETDEPERTSASTIRKSSRASRRGAGMVFLSVWALFGIGTLTANHQGMPPSTTTHIGKVLSGVGLPNMPVALSFPPPNPAELSPIIPLETDADTSPNSEVPHEDFPPPPNVPTERVLGRIFAWLCTTLYFTSRLPQIWKNYTRKSVEGLSMYLFVFAFLGNVFYVTSILTNDLPPAESAKYLRESIPYLLGSGGTLMFDITIVGQSFIYRRPSRRQDSTRKITQEEVGLLAEEA